MSINTVVVSGNLTRDPETRATPSGVAVVTFGVAVNERRKVGEEWTDEPNFFDVTMFGRRGEAVAQHVRKGSRVTVAGRLHWSQWDGKDGAKRSKVDIVANEVVFMQTSDSHQQPEPVASTPTAAPSVELYAEDIPF